MAEQRVRTWWRVRQRYQRAAWLAALVGAGVALVPIFLTLRDDGVQALTSVRALASSAALLAAGFFIPRWVVMMLWRRQKARQLTD